MRFCTFLEMTDLFIKTRSLNYILLFSFTKFYFKSPEASHETRHKGEFLPVFPDKTGLYIRPEFLMILELSPNRSVVFMLWQSRDLICRMCIM
jgi:hypothetical protein